MVKVKECCCGCSLRSGTFIIAWSLLIYNAFIFIINVYDFIYQRRLIVDYPQYYSEEDFPLSYASVYNVVRAIVGISVSLTASYALHKNKIVLLNGLYWYLHYMVVIFIVSIILLIFEPDWEESLVETNYLIKHYTSVEIRVSLVILYFFIAGIVSYFALIVKSYRDYSLRNEVQNVQFVGPDATTVGYIAA